MTRIRSILCNPLVSMPLIAASVAATGCVESTQPSSAEITGTASDHAVIAFTITTTVCTDQFPACVTQSGVGVASPGLPLTFGILVPGTAGATCSGAVLWVPPGASTSAIFACG